MIRQTTDLPLWVDLSMQIASPFILGAMVAYIVHVVWEACK